MLTAKIQAHSLLGRLEVLGPGSGAAIGRRWQAAEIERAWRKEESAHRLAIVGKKWDHRILDPLIFSGKIRKNTKS